MIVTFKDKETETIFNGYASARLPRSIQRAAYRKLRMLHAAINLAPLKAARGNKLHKLQNDREGQWSIAINDQYRICFLWDESTGNAYHVEIVDYH